jgi:hypothetical protein
MIKITYTPPIHANFYTGSCAHPSISFYKIKTPCYVLVSLSIYCYKRDKGYRKKAEKKIRTHEGPRIKKSWTHEGPSMYKKEEEKYIYSHVLKLVSKGREIT